LSSVVGLSLFKFTWTYDYSDALLRTTVLLVVAEEQYQDMVSIFLKIGGVSIVSPPAVFLLIYSWRAQGDDLLSNGQN
jgi:hypothetical protein